MPEAQSTAEIVMRIDGGARGNPGPAACGVVVETADGKPLAAFHRTLGKSTNNVAEYEALLAALGYALRQRYPRLKVLSDSELLVRQIRGEYKVRKAELKLLSERAHEMIRRFQSFTIEHVPREQNRNADRLVNQALDEAEQGAGSKPGSSGSLSLRTTATYTRGTLKAHQQLPLAEGEEVELEIRRKN